MPREQKALEKLILLARMTARDCGAESVRKVGARDVQYIARIDAAEHGTVKAALATAARVILRELPNAKGNSIGFMANALIGIVLALEFEPDDPAPPVHAHYYLDKD